MNINIHCIHFDADQKLIDLVNQKFKKFKKFEDYILDCEVFLKLEHKRGHIKDKTIEIKLKVKKDTLFVTAQEKSFETALDSAVKSLYNKLKKYKEKKIS